MINSLLVLALTLLRSGVAAQNDASIQRPVPPEAVVTFTTITAKPELFRRQLSGTPQLPGMPLFPGYSGIYTGPAWSSYIATVVNPASVQSCVDIANSIFNAYAQPSVYVTVTINVCGWSIMYLNTLPVAAATTSSLAAETTASTFLPSTSAYIPPTVQLTSSSYPMPAATSTSPAAASSTPQPTTSSTSIPTTTSSLYPTTSAPPSTPSVDRTASALSALLTDIPSTALYDDSQFGCFLQVQYGQTTPGWWSTLNSDEQSYLESDIVNTQPCTTSASSAASSFPKPTSASATRASPSLTVFSAPASTSNSLTAVVASQTTLIETPTSSSPSGGNSGAGLGPLGVSKTPSSTVTATSSPTAAPGGGGSGGSNGTKIGAGVGGALGGAAVIASIAFISKLAIQKYFPNKGANPSSAPPNNPLNPPANPNPTNGPHGPNINNGSPQAPNNLGNAGPGPGNPGSGPTNFAPPANPSSGPMVQMPPGNAPWVMGAGGRLVRQEERRPAPRPVPEGYVAYSGSQETSPTQRYGSPTQSWRSRSSEPLVGDQYLPGGRYEGGNGNGGGGYGRQMPGVGYGGDQGYGGQQQQGYAQQQPLGGYDQQQPQGGYGQQQGAGYGSAVPMPTQQQRRNLEQRAEVEGEMVEASGPRRYA